MKKPFIACIVACIALSVALCACSTNIELKDGDNSWGYHSMPNYYSESMGGFVDGSINQSSYNSYTKIEENKSVKTDEKSDIYLSLDNNTASYTNLRGIINGMKEGYGYYEIVPDAVRVEEMLNYFSYDYEAPEEGDFS